MGISFLERMVAFNNWANQRIIEACAALSDAQLDAAPQAAAVGSIRTTLIHLVEAQQGYAQELEPIGVEPVAVTYGNLAKAAARSGEDLLALAQGWSAETAITTRDGLYTVEPWLVMLQVINHAGEHREQIKAMLTAHGITPPAIDGWDFGKAEGALVRISD